MQLQGLVKRIDKHSFPSRHSIYDHQMSSAGCCPVMIAIITGRWLLVNSMMRIYKHDYHPSRVNTVSTDYACTLCPIKKSVSRKGLSADFIVLWPIRKWKSNLHLFSFHGKKKNSILKPRNTFPPLYCCVFTVKHIHCWLPLMEVAHPYCYEPLLRCMFLLPVF